MYLSFTHTLEVVKNTTYIENYLEFGGRTTMLAASNFIQIISTWSCSQ